MLIGVPKEIKNHEYRIGLTPSGARELIANGHKVMVQRDGGKSIGLTNEQYEKAGAEIVEADGEAAAIEHRQRGVELARGIEQHGLGPNLDTHS